MFLATLEPMSIDPAKLQKLLEERDKSRASRRRVWENLPEISWVLKEPAGIDLPPPELRVSTLTGGIVKGRVRKAL